MTLVRFLLAVVVLLLGYQGMVHAFDLLNRPSDRAVYEGTAFLVAVFVLLPFALWRLWRWS